MKEQAKHEEPLGKDTIESEAAAKNKRKNYNMLIIILILLLVFLVPMFATYLVFKYDAFAFWVEESSTGDFLGYFASFFALAATIIIAVRQTEISEEMYKIEKNLLNIEENRARIEALGRGVEFTAIGIIANKYNNQGISQTNHNNNENSVKGKPCYCKFGLVLKTSDTEIVKNFTVESVTCSSKSSRKKKADIQGTIIKGSNNTSLIGEKYYDDNSYVVFVNYNSNEYRENASIEYTNIICRYSYENRFGEEFVGEISCVKYWKSDEIKMVSCKNTPKKRGSENDSN